MIGRLWNWLCVAWGGYVAILAWRFYVAHDVARHRFETASIILVALAVARLLASLRDVSMPSSKTQERINWTSVASLTAAVAAVAFLYSTTVRIGFLSDDFVLTRWAREGNYFGRDWTFVRPAPLIIWRMALTFGDPALALHIANLLLHITNSILVMCIARRLQLRESAAATAGALFLLFPAAVEPVVWLAGIQDVLMTCGTLLFVWLLLADTRSSIRIPVATMAFAIAVLSKETGVVAPALAATLAWPLDPRFRRRVWIEAAAFGGVAATYAVWRALGTNSGIAEAPGRYVLKELLTRPYASLAQPWSAEILRDLPFVAVFAAVWLLFALISAVFLARRKECDAPRLLAAGAFVLIAAAPVYRLLFVSDNLQGSRYIYLPSAGWFLLTAILLDTIVRHGAVAHRFAAAALTAVLIVLDAYALRVHIRPWIEAAALRDRVLASAQSVTESAEATLCGAPSDVRGAYVLQNGFAEALTSSRSVTTRRESAALLRWDGRQFSPTTESDLLNCVTLAPGSR